MFFCKYSKSALCTQGKISFRCMGHDAQVGMPSANRCAGHLSHLTKTPGSTAGRVRKFRIQTAKSKE